MRRIALSVLLVSALALAILNLSGCETNIFEWAEEEEKGHMDRGLELMSEEKYAEAVDEFYEAIQADPTSSDARYYHAKATLNARDVNVLAIVRSFTLDAGNPGDLPIFTPDPTIPIEEDYRRKTNMYKANIYVVDDLKAIKDGPATVGVIQPPDILLDLTIASTIKSVLCLRDTNRDTVINAQDVVLDIDRLSAGGSYSIGELDSLLAEEGGEGINDLIDVTTTNLDESSDLLIDATQSFVEADVDTATISAAIDSLEASASKFYVNTGVPGNPGEGDNDGDGLVDEELLNGIDDDLDGLVDEDSHL